MRDWNVIVIMLNSKKGGGYFGGHPLFLFYTQIPLIIDEITIYGKEYRYL